MFRLEPFQLKSFQVCQRINEDHAQEVSHYEPPVNDFFQLREYGRVYQATIHALDVVEIDFGNQEHLQSLGLGLSILSADSNWEQFSQEEKDLLANIFYNYKVFYNNEVDAGSRPLEILSTLGRGFDDTASLVPIASAQWTRLGVKLSCGLMDKVTLDRNATKFDLEQAAPGEGKVTLPDPDDIVAQHFMEASPEEASKAFSCQLSPAHRDKVITSMVEKLSDDETERGVIRASLEEMSDKVSREVDELQEQNQETNVVAVGQKALLAFHEITKLYMQRVAENDALDAHKQQIVERLEQFNHQFNVRLNFDELAGLARRSSSPMQMEFKLFHHFNHNVYPAINIIEGWKFACHFQKDMQRSVSSYHSCMAKAVTCDDKILGLQAFEAKLVTGVQRVKANRWLDYSAIAGSVLIACKFVNPVAAVAITAGTAFLKMQENKSVNRQLKHYQAAVQYNQNAQNIYGGLKGFHLNIAQKYVTKVDQLFAHLVQNEDSIDPDDFKQGLVDRRQFYQDQVADTEKEITDLEKKKKEAMDERLKAIRKMNKHKKSSSKYKRAKAKYQEQQALIEQYAEHIDGLYDLIKDFNEDIQGVEELEEKDKALYPIKRYWADVVNRELGLEGLSDEEKREKLQQFRIQEQHHKSYQQYQKALAPQRGQVKGILQESSKITGNLNSLMLGLPMPWLKYPNKLVMTTGLLLQTASHSFDIYNNINDLGHSYGQVIKQYGSLWDALNNEDFGIANVIEQFVLPTLTCIGSFISIAAAIKQFFFPYNPNQPILDGIARLGKFINEAFIGIDKKLNQLGMHLVEMSQKLEESSQDLAEIREQNRYTIALIHTVNDNLLQLRSLLVLDQRKAIERIVVNELAVQNWKKMPNRELKLMQKLKQTTAGYHSLVVGMRNMLGDDRVRNELSAILSATEMACEANINGEYLLCDRDAKSILTYAYRHGVLSYLAGVLDDKNHGLININLCVDQTHLLFNYLERVITMQGFKLERANLQMVPERMADLMQPTLNFMADFRCNPSMFMTLAQNYVRLFKELDKIHQKYVARNTSNKRDHVTFDPALVQCYVPNLHVGSREDWQQVHFNTNLKMKAAEELKSKMVLKKDSGIRAVNKKDVLKTDRFELYPACFTEGIIGTVFSISPCVRRGDLSNDTYYQVHEAFLSDDKPELPLIMPVGFINKVFKDVDIISQIKKLNDLGVVHIMPYYEFLSLDNASKFSLVLHFKCMVLDKEFIFASMQIAEFDFSFILYNSYPIFVESFERQMTEYLRNASHALDHVLSLFYYLEQDRGYGKYPAYLSFFKILKESKRFGKFSYAMKDAEFHKKMPFSFLMAVRTHPGMYTKPEYDKFFTNNFPLMKSSHYVWIERYLNLSHEVKLYHKGFLHYLQNEQYVLDEITLIDKKYNDVIIVMPGAAIQSEKVELIPLLISKTMLQNIMQEFTDVDEFMQMSELAAGKLSTVVTYSIQVSQKEGEAIQYGLSLVIHGAYAGSSLQPIYCIEIASFKALADVPLDINNLLYLWWFGSADMPLSLAATYDFDFLLSHQISVEGSDEDYNVSAPKKEFTTNLTMPEREEGAELNYAYDSFVGLFHHFNRMGWKHRVVVDEDAFTLAHHMQLTQLEPDAKVNTEMQSCLQPFPVTAELAYFEWLKIFREDYVVRLVDDESYVGAVKNMYRYYEALCSLINLVTGAPYGQISRLLEAHLFLYSPQLLEAKRDYSPLEYNRLCHLLTGNRVTKAAIQSFWELMSVYSQPCAYEYMQGLRQSCQFWYDFLNGDIKDDAIIEAKLQAIHKFILARPMYFPHDDSRNRLFDANTQQERLLLAAKQYRTYISSMDLEHQQQRMDAQATRLEEDGGMLETMDILGESEEGILDIIDEQGHGYAERRGCAVFATSQSDEELEVMDVMGHDDEGTEQHVSHGTVPLVLD